MATSPPEFFVDVCAAGFKEELCQLAEFSVRGTCYQRSSVYNFSDVYAFALSIVIVFEAFIALLKFKLRGSRRMPFAKFRKQFGQTGTYVFYVALIIAFGCRAATGFNAVPLLPNSLTGMIIRSVFIGAYAGGYACLGFDHFFSSFMSRSSSSFFALLIGAVILAGGCLIGLDLTVLQVGIVHTVEEQVLALTVLYAFAPPSMLILALIGATITNNKRSLIVNHPGRMYFGGVFALIMSCAGIGGHYAWWVTRCATDPNFDPSVFEYLALILLITAVGVFSAEHADSHQKGYTDGDPLAVVQVASACDTAAAESMIVSPAPLPQPASSTAQAPAVAPYASDYSQEYAAVYAPAMPPSYAETIQDHHHHHHGHAAGITMVDYSYDHEVQHEYSDPTGTYYSQHGSDAANTYYSQRGDPNDTYYSRHSSVHEQPASVAGSRRSSVRQDAPTITFVQHPESPLTDVESLNEPQWEDAEEQEQGETVWLPQTTPEASAMVDIYSSIGSSMNELGNLSD